MLINNWRIIKKSDAQELLFIFILFAKTDGEKKLKKRMKIKFSVIYATNLTYPNWLRERLRKIGGILMRVNSYGMKYVINIDASIENGVGIVSYLT